MIRHTTITATIIPAAAADTMMGKGREDEGAVTGETGGEGSVDVKDLEVCEADSSGVCDDINKRDCAPLDVRPTVVVSKREEMEGEEGVEEKSGAVVITKDERTEGRLEGDGERTVVTE